MNRLSWQRAVIKVGSALIAPEGRGCNPKLLQPLAQFVMRSQQAGKDVIIVSSGSVAAGRQQVPVTHRPTIAEKQAMAAIGQTQMMACWQQLFDRPCAQLLLTAGDLHDRTRYVNIKNTINQLLKHGAVPIINENDTVAVDELKVGDNDNLAAYTALVAQADTLIICSDVDGLYTADPRKNPAATRLDKIFRIDEKIMRLAGGAGSAVGTGGMLTKLQAAQTCMGSGIQTCIINGHHKSAFDALIKGKLDGSLFCPSQAPVHARKLWLQHTLKSRGSLVVDAGAMAAVKGRGASLLAKGIVGVEGKFRVGDAVTIACDNTFFAKGLVNYSSDDLLTLKGSKSSDFEQLLGFTRGPEIVHRDDLILLASPSD
ncbi:glutamate 5-kinase [Salinimonas sp. HHU 13199]|uniref:Glutamate 5-kinase n=1 Tax=Salinimonas profundi TaxID=2729140 RepID=A0ABR8LHP6_9ALTE|nr:glutamate 5-kinase [Salinimonas profundi]MBD3585767.1 glutamate 5-kinase [Salinimonas profundi]